MVWRRESATNQVFAVTSLGFAKGRPLAYSVTLPRGRVSLNSTATLKPRVGSNMLYSPEQPPIKHSVYSGQQRHPSSSLNSIWWPPDKGSTHAPQSEGGGGEGAKRDAISERNPCALPIPKFGQARHGTMRAASPPQVPSSNFLAGG